MRLWPSPTTPVSFRPANLCMALTALMTVLQACSWLVDLSEGGRYPYFVNQSCAGGTHNRGRFFQYIKSNASHQNNIFNIITTESLLVCWFYHQLGALVHSECHWCRWWRGSGISDGDHMHPSTTQAKKKHPHFHLSYMFFHMYKCAGAARIHKNLEVNSLDTVIKMKNEE